MGGNLVKANSAGLESPVGLGSKQLGGRRKEGIPSAQEPSEILASLDTKVVFTGAPSRSGT